MMETATVKEDSRVIAYCIEPSKEYRLDLTPYGVRPTWGDDSIWTVAHREMNNQYGKTCTAWVVV